MLRQRDLEIIEFARKHGITIEQCYKMFFNHARYGMDLARKRLKKLYEKGHLLRGNNWDANKMVYYHNRIPSMHRILLADFYSELIFNDAVVLEFIPEYKTKYVRSDAFIRYIYKGYEIIQFVEVVLTHKVNFDKYEQLKDTGEIQKHYDVFPSVVVIDHNPIKFVSDKLKIISLNHNLEKFKESVLP